jgi:hypothetical protein
VNPLMQIPSRVTPRGTPCNIPLQKERKCTMQMIEKYHSCVCRDRKLSDFLVVVVIVG